MSVTSLLFSWPMRLWCMRWKSRSLRKRSHVAVALPATVLTRFSSSRSSCRACCSCWLLAYASGTAPASSARSCPRAASSYHSVSKLSSVRASPMRSRKLRTKSSTTSGRRVTSPGAGADSTSSCFDSVGRPPSTVPRPMVCKLRSAASKSSEASSSKSSPSLPTYSSTSTSSYAKSSSLSSINSVSSAFASAVSSGAPGSPITNCAQGSLRLRTTWNTGVRFYQYSQTAGG
mmetsp:Transcript_23904/g.45419  ORF Transcript_23904/g.45419 Transcript_23904/m.45419 type:complete len:232 (-) Transcript_23904:82-777(-)